jgi:hypothetical protein
VGFRAEVSEFHGNVYEAGCFSVYCACTVADDLLFRDVYGLHYQGHE